MRTSTRLAAAALIALVPFAANAEEDEPARPYFYATYFDCDATKLWRADEIAETVFGPVYDAAVASGKIGGWGWMAHHTGGKWRRLVYHVAPSIEALLDGQESVNDKVDAKHEPAARELGQICGSHEDYIWQRVNGSRGDGSRGAASFSVYMICDISEEERADELVEEFFAPIYNRHVGDGKLKSWGWSRHIIGGQWRRLATMSAADFKTLLKMRASIVEEIQGKRETKQFNEICSSHEDYMWEIQRQKP